MKLTGLSGDATLRVGHLLYVWFKQIYAERAGSIASCRNILDFGCGWGRILRFFLKDLPPERIWGVDVVADFIRISRQTNRWCRFEEVGQQPPSGLPAGTFDLIFCNSVFSHFSERAHEQWLGEFRRLLSPGGLLIATTWPRQFIEARDRTIQDYPEWMRPAAAFLDKPKQFADYDAGRYCFSPVPDKELAVLDTADWGEACISKRYVVDRWTQYLEFVDFIDDASRYPQRGLYPQNVIVARRRV